MPFSPASRFAGLDAAAPGLNRRQLLHAAVACGAGAACTPSSALAGPEPAAGFGRAKHVIHIYLHGGAATQDMFDLKPRAPAEIRGEFAPISTNVPGIEICEHLPKLARWMDRCAIVRSMHHSAGCHNTLPSFTGSEQPVNVNELTPRSTYPPAMGAVCEFLKSPQDDLPHYVALPTWLGWGFSLKRPGPWGGFLGYRFDPVLAEYQPVIEQQPAPDRQPVWVGAPQLAATELPSELNFDRLTARRGLLAQFNRASTQHLASEEIARTWQRAFRLLTASALRKAFDISAEPPEVRERYGPHVPGNSALIARRLVEAGVRFIDVYFDGYGGRAPGAFDTYWDTHSANFTQLKRANLPCFDQTLDALLDDLDARGLLEETLIVVNTDFGRTPRVNGSAGRDHWTFCYSAMLAGAGIRGGTLCGESDSHAAYVKDRPVRPADLCATVFHCLGIDPHLALTDRLGRPTAVANGGEPIREVLS